MLLSLCVIARNEARWVERCLTSAVGIADELIVVDTGSTDDTQARAERTGARVSPVAWTDDFSAPRNHALSLARGAWVLQLDADEFLTEPSRRTLRAALEPARFDCALLRLHNASELDATADDVIAGKRRLGEPVWLPRVFRRMPGLSWSGVVHENVDGWLSTLPEPPQALAVDIVHVGAVPALRRSLGKSTRNITLLEKRWAAHPDDLMAAGYLALEHFQSGDFPAAQRVADAGWARLEQWPPGKSLLRLAAARALLAAQAQDAQGMLATVQRAIGSAGEHPDSFFLEGRAHELQAQRAELAPARASALRRAARAYEAALAMAGRGDWRVSFEGVSHAGCVLRLATVHAAAAQFGQTVAVLAALGPERPAEAVALAAEAELAAGRPDAALAALGALLGSAKPSRDVWLLSAAAARELGSEKDAALFLERALASDQPLWAWHRAERYGPAAVR